jgi:hypothetical protein
MANLLHMPLLFFHLYGNCTPKIGIGLLGRNNKFQYKIYLNTEEV